MSSVVVINNLRFLSFSCVLDETSDTICYDTPVLSRIRGVSFRALGKFQLAQHRLTLHSQIGK